MAVKKNWQLDASEEVSRPADFALTNGVPAEEYVSSLFTSANTSLVSSTRYALAASDASSGSTLADRTINRVTMTASVQTFVMPNRDADKARDFIVRVEVGDLETIGGIAFSGVTAWEGDALTFEKNKNYLVAITETKYANNAPTWLIKVLALDPQTQG